MEIEQGLRLTGHFLEREILTGRAAALGEARHKVLRSLKNEVPPQVRKADQDLARRTLKTEAASGREGFQDARKLPVVQIRTY